MFSVNGIAVVDMKPFKWLCHDTFYELDDAISAVDFCRKNHFDLACAWITYDDGRVVWLEEYTDCVGNIKSMLVE